MGKVNETYALSERLDYDNLFKTVLLRYFWEALKIFLPDLYEAADRTVEPEFLEQELQKVTFDLEGGINRTDLLARIKLKNGSGELILCHLEVQGEGGGELDLRMYRYKEMIHLTYGEEPIGIAILTAPRPRKEKTFYSRERFGVTVTYNYINVNVIEMEDDVLLADDSRIGLVLYAAKCAYLSGGDEDEKFRYLRLLSNLWSERGWDKNDKRIILLAIDYLLNLSDETHVKEMVAHIESLTKREEEREMYVSIFERVYKEEGRVEGRAEVARRMLNKGLSVDKVAEYTDFPREEIEAISRTTIQEPMPPLTTGFAQL